MKNEYGSDELRKVVLSIAENIKDESISLPDGTLSWVSPHYHDDRLVMSSASGVYRGHLGIGLFFAALYNHSGQKDFLRVALDTAKPFIDCDISNFQSNIPIGMGDGLGSYIYGLVKIAEFTGREEILESAYKLCELLTTEKLESDDSYDVITGCSGVILAISSLYENYQNKSLLKIASTCGEHLLRNRIERRSGLAWETTPAMQPLTGFAHGTAGIGYALVRLSDLTGRSRYLTAANKAFAYEDSLFSVTKNNWPDLQYSNSAFRNAWCHGRTGIILARLGCMKYSEEVEFKIDVHQVLHAQSLDQLPYDILCHGNAGMLDSLLEAYKQSGKKRHMSVIDSLVTKIVEEWEKDQNFQLPFRHIKSIYRPSLFCGTAGIGYVLLRILSDEKYPSVLLFE